MLEPHPRAPAVDETDASPAADARLRPRGSNQGGMRQFNERVVLQAIRLHGPLAKAEIARLTHLTAQTVQLIIARLEADELVTKLAPVRGKVGQPSVPMALNPDGAFSIGLAIGRRRLDMLLVDFTGAVRERLSLDYRFPDPATLFDAIDERLRALRKRLKPALRARLQGLGVAAPLAIGGWQRLLDIAPDVAERWQATDLRVRLAALGERHGLAVSFVKDTAAACVAELVAGRGHSMRSFLYVFVDTFVGGGLVLDSHLALGRQGNAGAVGSLPLAVAGSSEAPPPQLLSVASLWALERLYAEGGLTADAWRDERALRAPWRDATLAWLEPAAAALALAATDAACLLDIDRIVVDGSFGRGLLDALLSQTEAALARYRWEGATPPRVVAGTVGPDARALGGALLPLHANFAPDRDLFLKASAETRA